MRELDLLSSLSLSNNKCDLCVESKSTKNTCKLVLSREIEFLNLVHNDLGDLKQTMTRRNVTHVICFPYFIILYYAFYRKWYFRTLDFFV